MIIDILNKDAKATVFVYTTCRDREEARSLARSAVENHLAVCGDFWEVESVYPWHGVLQDVDQCMLMLTTVGALADKLSTFLSGLHSYDVPLFVTTQSLKTSDLYKIWMDKTLEESGKFNTPEEAAASEAYESEGGYHPGKLK